MDRFASFTLALREVPSASAHDVTLLDVMTLVGLGRQTTKSQKDGRVMSHDEGQVSSRRTRTASYVGCHPTKGELDRGIGEAHDACYQHEKLTCIRPTC